MPNDDDKPAKPNGEQRKARPKRSRNRGSRAIGRSEQPPPERLDVPTVEPGTSLVLVSKREKRIAQIEQWLGQGLTPRQASAKARAHFYLRHGRADALVALVLKRLRMDADDEPRESKKARVIAQLQEVVRVAFERGDLKAANGALKVIALVDGHIDHSSGIIEMKARAMAERDREAFVAAVRGRLGEEKWAEFAAAVDGARAGSGAAAPSSDAATVEPAEQS